MGPIGVFDSGYGGLTVLKELVAQLPQYDYIYLGDNARAPYGTRSFETVYRYTLQCVQWLLDKGCPLVILACNTASAKALRNIQQKVLPVKYPNHRVLGVIRPTAEVVGTYSHSGHIGVMGTRGTVNSGSYLLEIKKFFPEMNVVQQSCPMWVPLVENNEHLNAGADYFLQQYLGQLLEQDADIDCILLACTHYPLLMEKIRSFLPQGITLLGQGEIVAESLSKYLKNHLEIASDIACEGKRLFYTSGDTQTFDRQASVFFGERIQSAHAKIQAVISV